MERCCENDERERNASVGSSTGRPGSEPHRVRPKSKGSKTLDGEYAENTPAGLVLSRDKVLPVVVRSKRKFLCFAQKSDDLCTGGIPYRRFLKDGKTIHELLIVFRSK